MISVQINGEVAPIQAGNCGQMTEVVELIKSVIDPDHMITSILLNGEQFNETDWSRSMNSLDTALIEVETGTPQEFVFERLARSELIVQSCLLEFRGARGKFQQGNSVEGNKQLVEGVQALQAFFQWYGTLLELVPTESRPQFDLTTEVNEISETCKSICQQQLYQSWWALGESLEQKLEPQLEGLVERCKNFYSEK